MLQDAQVWEQIELAGQKLVEGLRLAAEDANITISANQVGTMFGFYFTEGPVTNWSTAKVADTRRFAAFFQAMLEQGVYLAPSQFEAGFLSVIKAAARAFAAL
ncbi:MAG TPA: hypothetical protein PKE45_24525 [Caldilineaceae bacterium]|nr:hypothetical protein [Caldilineaceae bacterium]